MIIFKTVAKRFSSLHVSVKLAFISIISLSIIIMTVYFLNEKANIIHSKRNDKFFQKSSDNQPYNRVTPICKREKSRKSFNVTISYVSFYCEYQIVEECLKREEFVNFGFTLHFCYGRLAQFYSQCKRYPEIFHKYQIFLPGKREKYPYKTPSDLFDCITEVEGDNFKIEFISDPNGDWIDNKEGRIIKKGEERWNSLFKDVDFLVRIDMDDVLPGNYVECLLEIIKIYEEDLNDCYIHFNLRNGDSTYLLNEKPYYSPLHLYGSILSHGITISIPKSEKLKNIYLPFITDLAKVEKYLDEEGEKNKFCVKHVENKFIDKCMDKYLYIRREFSWSLSKKQNNAVFYNKNGKELNLEEIDGKYGTKFTELHRIYIESKTYFENIEAEKNKIFGVALNTLIILFFAVLLIISILICILLFLLVWNIFRCTLRNRKTKKKI